MSDTFQVDLRGIVDLLAHHLYSSPKVYVRELLQNGVDALSVRGESDDVRPGVLFVPADVSEDGGLFVLDSGQGLDAGEVRQFLATIGRSSKRDELGFARADLLGQFGIGLLSCFLVTDEIELWSRSAKADDARFVHWRGHGDGTYELTEVQLEDVPAAEVRRWLAHGPGTCVRLAPRRGSEHWLSTDRVTTLARSVGSLLPYDVRVRQAAPVSQAAGATAEDARIAPSPAPWTLTEPIARRAASVDYARDVMGIRALTVLPISVPEAGLQGMAVILASDTGPGGRPVSRVHLKGMLLDDEVPGLQPDWAFFARCAVDSTGLRPTASREGLYDDDLLESVRASIGDQLRHWLRRLAETDRAAMADFLLVHERAMKAAALHDDELLRIVLPLLRFDTTAGVITLDELRSRFDIVYVAETVDEFRHIAQVAAAQGIGVVNGGWTDDGALVRRLPDIDPTARVQPITASELESHIGLVADGRALAVAGSLADARAALADLGVDVELREFAPASLAALYLDDSQSRRLRESRSLAREADEVWAGLLTAFDDGRSARPRLVLNDANPTVRRVLGVSDPGLRRVGVESLYCRALLLGHHPMKPADTALLDRSFLALLDQALDASAPEDRGGSPAL